MRRSVLYAIFAAMLFGASTPFAKLLVDEVPPLLLGGLLYLGSGIGLGAARVARDRRWIGSGLVRHEWPWLLGAVLAGGVVGPVALLYGLVSTSGSTASLLLNLEAVLTAMLAWIVFRENAGTRVILGMATIVAGAVVLTWPVGAIGTSGVLGPLAIAFACLCWAIDNNLTRKVSGADALFVAGSKGLIAGVVNVGLAMGLGIALPAPTVLLGTLLLGFLGYGVSLVLFVLALRGLGTARTGAYFSTAPFIGAALALLLLDESAPPAFWLAGALMGVGVWLHLTERHEHEHTHEPQEHSHMHVHDEHHRHTHDFEWNGREPHAHVHRHLRITHKHPHYPDIHHRHAHKGAKG